MDDLLVAEADGLAVMVLSRVIALYTYATYLSTLSELKPLFLQNSIWLFLFLNFLSRILRRE